MPFSTAQFPRAFDSGTWVMSWNQVWAWIELEGLICCKLKCMHCAGIPSKETLLCMYDVCGNHWSQNSDTHAALRFHSLTSPWLLLIRRDAVLAQGILYILKMIEKWGREAMGVGLAPVGSFCKLWDNTTPEVRNRVREQRHSGRDWQCCGKTLEDFKINEFVLSPFLRMISEQPDASSCGSFDSNTWFVLPDLKGQEQPGALLKSSLGNPRPRLCPNKPFAPRAMRPRGDGLMRHVLQFALRLARYVKWI